jgi:hypothetical protein
MQIIEVTDLWVRSGVVRFKRRDTRLEFVVYPMIHMAAASFYTEVAVRVKRADIAVVEGIGRGANDGSVLVGALTLSYRVLRFNRRVRLVRQDIDYAALGVELVRPDVSSVEFKEGWRQVPLRHRLVVWLLLPVVMLIRLFGGTRTIWSRSMEQNDLPTPEEEDATDAMPEFDAAFGGRRDDRLLAALREIHEDHGDDAIEVAVVYGAGHVPAIVRGLGSLGYRPRSSEWLIVADV